MADDTKTKAAKLVQRTKSRSEREAQIAAQRKQFHTRERNKRIFNYAILIIIVLVLAIGLYTWLMPEDTGKHDALAKCLTNNGVIMYGTEWCPHCQEQKQLFGASFAYVTFVNCDTNAAACAAAGIEGFPTWIFADKTNATGKQELSVLADRAGCQ